MASPYVFSYSMKDSLGIVNTTPPIYYVPTTPSTVTIAEILVDWAAIGDQLDAFSGGQIVAGGFSVPGAISGSWKSTPAAGSLLSQIMSLNFSNASNRYSQSVVLQAYLASDLTGGRPDLTTLAALISLFETGGLTNGSASTEEAALLVALVDAFLSVRKHRRQSRNKTIITP